jgi:hypothetical protein
MFAILAERSLTFSYVQIANQFSLKKRGRHSSQISPLARAKSSSLAALWLRRLRLFHMTVPLILTVWAPISSRSSHGSKSR